MTPRPVPTPRLRLNVRPQGVTLPRAYSPADRDRLAVMKLEMTTPSESWYTTFTRRNPELVVEVTNAIEVADNNTLAEIEVYGPPVDWVPEISKLPDVREVESFGQLPGFRRYRVRYLTSSIIRLARELEILIRYPRTVQNGTLTCETIARLSQLRRLVEALRTLGTEPRIDSLRRETLRSVRLSLTASQRALFRQALALGYFEVPRRISLSRLAERVSRSKSSVSEMLAVVERKLVHSAKLT
jgi:predicted DNA binding protein